MCNLPTSTVMERVIYWFKHKLGVTDLEADNAQLRQEINTLKGKLERTTKLQANLNTQLGELTYAHCDVNLKAPTQVILVGRYRNRDYVKVYDLPGDSLVDLREHLQRMEINKHSRFDAAPGVSSLVFDY